MKLRTGFLVGALLPVLAVSALAQDASPIGLVVDMTEAPRKILHAHLTMPVQPGPLTLVYPEWIPGEHGPTGPVVDVAALIIRTGDGGKTLAWRRDDVDMFAIHVDVPPGTTSLDIHLDFLASGTASGFSAGASTSASLAMLSWNDVVLYPAGKNASEVLFAPSVKLPEGWKYGTALTPAGGNSTEPRFETVSLEQLVDSPLLAGRYFREIVLAPEVTPKHFLDLVADGPEDLEIKPQLMNAFSDLVRQTGALYQSRHYHSYHFLVTLSDEVAHFGLEHHQSSDDRVAERTLIDPNKSLLEGGLLPHEFSHSWNGKYRRPAGLATSNYQEPMKGDLLWVYEGLTEYLGDVLTARSHIWTPEQYREALAYTAATLDYRPGRTWRDLEDTAVDAQILYDAPGEWTNWRRGTDFYEEGELLWLQVDTMIRKMSSGKRSLNDFCARFHGLGGNTGPKVVPYTFADVVTTLNDVQPYDWASFLREKLTTKEPHAPLGGITEGGYKISFQDKPTEYEEAEENDHGGVLAWWSLGLDLDPTGKIGDVLVGSPADKAGLGPGMEIVAVDGRAYSNAQLKLALDEAKGNPQPIEMIVSNTSYFKVVKVDYHDGQRYPYLERVNGTPDLLDSILEPQKVSPGKNY